jgi:hypothetical protein
MLYRELINFTPIESVKQLRAAGDESSAREDVRTYVISGAMSQQLVDVVIPTLRFDNPEWDHKGLLLIATYGTGKTHLMSCLAGVAEHAEMAAELTDEATKSAAATIAGQFKVVRVEIGAVQMGLRDIITRELTEALSAMGVEYVFAPLDQVTNNKSSLRDMMNVFEKAYPDQGLLLVVDELLDYLRTRRDAEVILDLGFLREIGEFCRDSRFRLIAGVQESLFDNPRFSLAQDEVRRVRERYQSFRIVREDVAYVVQRRILGKTDAQRALIRTHLAKFARAFESLSADLDGFVEMFPIHPAFLRTFESLTIVEKRRVLSSLTEQIRLRLDGEVPDGEPGLICSDSYRAELAADPSNSVIPEVREVLARTRVLRERVERGMEVPSDVAPALRIVDALAVNRLTTDDITAPIGMTIDELRDDLCLLPSGTPELDPAFLSNTIETLVSEIAKAVSGQFLSMNEDNGQVYLDISKDVDYEQQVDERAATLDDDRLDAAYYKALAQVLEVANNSYVAGYRIWSYELPWVAHKVTRQGYLFMGAPNERSTAQPPRDFYLYFVQPYALPRFDDDAKPDEVFLRLDTPEVEFTTSLRRYAAALEKAQESTSQHRSAFENRMKKHLAEMVKWIKENLSTHLQVTYQGEVKPLGQWLAAVPGTRASLKEQLDAIAASALASHFSARYPGYPVFKDEITVANLLTNAQAALRMLAMGGESAMARTVLDSLELRDIDGKIVDNGTYATALKAPLDLASGSAVNASELLAERDGGVFTWGPWHLEPTWLVVVAAALAYQGKAELGFANGERIGAQNLDALTRMSGEELAKLAFLTVPAGSDTAALRGLAQLLDIPPGSIKSPLPADIVIQLVTKALDASAEVANTKAYVQGSPRLWGEEVFDDPSARTARIDTYISILNDAKARNTAGKMARFSASQELLKAAAEGKVETARVDALRRASETLSPLTSFLDAATNTLGATDPNADQSRHSKDRLRALLRAPEFDKTVATAVRQDLESLCGIYRQFAVERHTADRLTSAGDTRKVDLTNSDRFRDLRALTAIDMLPSGQFGAIETALVNLVTCKQFTADVFDRLFTCPRCAYRPAPSTGPTAEQKLAAAEQQVSETWDNWVASLRDSVNADEISVGIGLLTNTSRAVVVPLMDGTLTPGGVTGELVEAIRQLLRKFDVVRVTPGDVWDGVFAGASSMTVEQAAERMTGWLNTLVVGRADRASVRIVPEGDV